MKKLITLFTAFLLVATLSLSSSAQAATTYVNQSDIDVLDTASKAFGEFVDETNKDSATIATVEAKATVASAAFDAVNNHGFSTELGEKYTTEAAALKNEANDLKTKINEVSSVLQSNDQTKIENYFNELNDSATRFDQQGSKLNAAVDESNNASSIGYLWLVIATGVLAAGAFAWAFLVNKQASSELTKSGRTIAYASLAPLAGALITYVTFIFADKLGGSYFIAYGPVLFGGIVFVQSITKYVAQAKQTKVAHTLQ